MPERLVVMSIAARDHRRCCVYPDLCWSGTHAMARSARSVLKMKRLIRPGHAFLRSRVCGCRQASRAQSATAQRSSLGAL